MSLDLDHFSARILQDALTEATSSYCGRRAREFERARSRPGDYTGQATPGEIRAADARLTAAAQACRARATLALDDDLTESVRAVLNDDHLTDVEVTR